jgi:hypothetical protein
MHVPTPPLPTLHYSAGLRLAHTPTCIVLRQYLRPSFPLSATACHRLTVRRRTRHTFFNRSENV